MPINCDFRAHLCWMSSVPLIIGAFLLWPNLVPPKLHATGHTYYLTYETVFFMLQTVTDFVYSTYELDG